MSRNQDILIPKSSFFSILEKACRIESNSKSPELKHKEQIEALHQLHALLHSQSLEWNIVHEISGNTKVQTHIRQIVCICLMMQSNNALKNKKISNSNTHNIQDTKEQIGIVWETIATLFESCGGKWILESSSPTKTNHHLGIAGTLCLLLQLCAGELRIQLGASLDHLSSSSSSNTSLPNHHHNESTTLQIVSAGTRILIANISHLISFSEHLEVESIHSDWEGLSFDAILHLKQSLDDAHDSIFQYLGSLSPSSSSSPLSKNTISLASCLVRCMGAWLYETELEDIRSPSVQIIQQAILNSIWLCSHNVNTIGAQIISSNTTKTAFLDLLPALVKLISDPGVSFFRNEEYSFMGKSVLYLIQDICQYVISLKNDSPKNDSNLQTKHVESIMIFPRLNWAFAFLQQYQQRMIEDGNFKTIEYLWKTNVSDPFVFPEEGLPESILQHSISKHNSKESNLLIGSILESIELMHEELCSISPSSSSQGQAMLDVSYIQEVDIAMQLFRTLCDGIQCWCSLISTSQKREANVFDKNIQSFQSTLISVLGSIYNANIANYDNSTSTSLSAEWMTILHETASFVSPMLSSVESETKLNDSILENIKQWYYDPLNLM